MDDRESNGGESELMARGDRKGTLDAAAIFADLESEARDWRERDELAAFVRWTRLAGDSDPAFGFRGACAGDVTGDTGTSVDDLLAYFDAFDRGDAIADHDLDGEVTSEDVAAFLNDYDDGCGITTSLSVDEEKSDEPKTR